MVYDFNSFAHKRQSERLYDRVQVLQSVVCITEYMTDPDQIKACLKGFLGDYIRQYNEIMTNEDDNDGKP